MVLLQARDVSKSAKEAERLVGEGRCVEAQHKLLWAVGEMGDIGGSLYECSQEGCMTEEAESRLRLKMISDVADARTAVANVTNKDSEIPVVSLDAVHPAGGRGSGDSDGPHKRAERRPPSGADCRRAIWPRPPIAVTQGCGSRP
jgi:hypothetical protein